MAVPTPLHYWLVRLRVFRRRRVWAMALGFLVLGLVGHQYLNHPEWLQGFTLDEEDRAGSAGADLSELSQEELADLAEVDNLSLLLNQLQPITANTLAEVPATTPPPETTAALALPSPATVAPLRSSDGESPFAAYLERTQFRVGSLATLDDPAAAETPNPDPLSLGGSAPLSPLQRFLSPAESAVSASENPSSPDEEVPSSAASTPERLTPTTSTGLTPPPWVVEGSVPGVNQPFIRTTPEMSPPPGTTGYALPPSLATPSSQGLPSVPSNPGLPSAPALNLSPSPTSSGAVTVPNPSGVGNTLPPSSGLNTYTQPAAGIPEPAPFSAPRPPGTYTGGGYINTFSDPSGPVD
ncbi:MAG: hypothetical protein ACHWZW_19000 [Spirulina sp.]